MVKMVAKYTLVFLDTDASFVVSTVHKLGSLVSC